MITRERLYLSFDDTKAAWVPTSSGPPPGGTKITRMTQRTPKPHPAPKTLSPSDYLIKILNAKVYDVARETALETASTLSARLGHTVLLKREDQQPVFSFKLRGAYNKMAHLSAAQLKKASSEIGRAHV